MKSRGTITVVILLAFIACFLLFKWKHDEPRRRSLEALQDFRGALDTGSPAILNKIVVPPALIGRTISEQSEFLAKALRDEISTDGIAALKANASFGPLTDLFPQQAGTWTTQAGVNPEDCVAFKMERSGIRAEVVLVRDGKSYRVVRCNNVKQMASERPRT